MEGYKVKEYKGPVKRYCRTMNLKDNPELIAEYRKRHSQEHSWKEIREGIKQVGILEMEIYILGNRLFMIVETPLDFDMSIFQDCEQGATATEKWQMMERMFYLYD